jgi:hypothetical protein
VTELLQQANVCPIGQSKVGNHEIEPALAGELQPFLACASQGHGESCILQSSAERVESGAVLVDDEDRGHISLVWGPGEKGLYLIPTAVLGRRPVPLIRRFDFQQGGGVFFGKDVQQPVGALSHIANALMQIAQQRLAPQLLPVVVEHDALQLAGAGNLAFTHAADEQVAFQLGKRSPL